MTELPSAPTWHAQESDQCIARLRGDPDGLSGAEAERRLRRHGPNRLPEGRRVGPVMRFLRQFHNLLLYLMLGAAVITALLGHWVDTGVIVAAVLINVIIGFIQEGKAEDALASIRRLLSSQARVLREGRVQGLPGEALVPGDLVLLAGGEQVAPGRGPRGRQHLRIEGAGVSGEALPEDKRGVPAAVDGPLRDGVGMAWSGDLGVNGHGRGRVVGPGAHT